MQNVDVVHQPQPPDDATLSSCSIILMPWSPFPCTYDSKYSGIPGQKTQYCYTDSSKAGWEMGPNELSTNLTTDGYTNLFFGVLPQQLCSGVQNPDVVQLLLTTEFRIATGRQFDRTYTFQIGHAVVSGSMALAAYSMCLAWL